jgi:hypothetical protein
VVLLKASRAAELEKLAESLPEVQVTTTEESHR